MKRETEANRVRLANDLMYHIYTHIDRTIDIEALAKRHHVSRFHMQRIFKEVFGRNIYETVKSIRLEKAANLLLVNRHSTISEVARACGYTSHTAFVTAFGKRFGMTPTAWRRGGFRRYSDELLEQVGEARRSRADFSALVPTIVRADPIDAYYIRHAGYDEGIATAWRQLQTFAYSHGLEEAPQIGLYHDNPAVIPPSRCHYVACLATERVIAGARLPRFQIAGGVYARFDLQGFAGDDIKLIHWIYNEWIPQNGYETSPKPSYAIYRKNRYLDPEGAFDMSYFVSIRY